MLSLGFSVKLTFVVFSGFLLRVASLDSNRQCFDVGEERFCYFIPNVSSVDWDTAWKTCRDLKSTLPVIPDKEVQNVLVKYLIGHYSILPVWTAGRYTGDSEWKWLNGQIFRGEDKPSCPHHASSCYHETQAVLSQQLKYEAAYPNTIYPYICSFIGASCTSELNDSTRWKAGCLQWEKTDRLRLNEARNKCIERGGELATFSGQEDLRNLERFSHMFNNPDTRYWIGLHRKWWIWNTTGSNDDIKYNLLKNYVDDRLKLNCLFITERSHEWMRDSCNNTKKVICQTVSYPKRTNSTTNVIIGLVIAVLAVAIIIVVLIVLTKKRAHVGEAEPDAGTSTTKLDPKTPSQKAIVEYQDDTYATIDLDDDLENLNYENGPNPSTSYTKVECCDDPSAVYSEPTDFSASEPIRSNYLYSEPNSCSIVTPAPKNFVGPSSDIYSEVNKPGQQKKSDELTSPPIKIGPQGDIYTLPISHN